MEDRDAILQGIANGTFRAPLPPKPKPAPVPADDPNKRNTVLQGIGRGTFKAPVPPKPTVTVQDAGVSEERARVLRSIKMGRRMVAPGTHPLEPLRAIFRRHGLRPTSGQRTPEENRRVGGAKNSLHLYDSAEDWAGTREQMAAAMQEARAYLQKGAPDHLAEFFGPGASWKNGVWSGGRTDHDDHIHAGLYPAWKKGRVASAKPKPAAAPGRPARPVRDPAAVTVPVSAKGKLPPGAKEYDVLANRVREPRGFVERAGRIAQVLVAPSRQEAEDAVSAEVRDKGPQVIVRTPFEIQKVQKAIDIADQQWDAAKGARDKRLAAASPGRNQAVAKEIRSRFFTIPIDDMIAIAERQRGEKLTPLQRQAFTARIMARRTQEARAGQVGEATLKDAVSLAASAATGSVAARAAAPLTQRAGAAIIRRVSPRSAEKLSRVAASPFGAAANPARAVGAAVEAGTEQVIQDADKDLTLGERLGRAGTSAAGGVLFSAAVGGVGRAISKGRPDVPVPPAAAAAATPPAPRSRNEVLARIGRGEKLSDAELQARRPVERGRIYRGRPTEVMPHPEPDVAPPAPAPVPAAAASPAATVASGVVESTEEVLHKSGSNTPKPGRIQVDPIQGGKKKQLVDIVRDFEKGIHHRVRRSNMKPGISASYFPGTTASLFKRTTNIDDVAHEAAGHLIDDRFTLARSGNFDSELIPQFSQHGSVTPGTPVSIQRAEGFAEFMRAYVANPNAARAAAPRMTAYLEATLDRKTLNAIRNFSDDYRRFAGLEGGTQLGANMRTSIAKPSIPERAKTYLFGEGRSEFETTGGDRTWSAWADDLWPVMKGIAHAKRITGKKPLPSKDPETLIPLLAGAAGKIDDIIRKGMVTADLERIPHLVGGFKRMIEPITSSVSKAVRRHGLDDVRQLMVAERIINIADRKDTAKATLDTLRRSLSVTRADIAATKRSLRKVGNLLTRTKTLLGERRSEAARIARTGGQVPAALQRQIASLENSVKKYTANADALRTKQQDLTRTISTAMSEIQGSVTRARLVARKRGTKPKFNLPPKAVKAVDTVKVARKSVAPGAKRLRNAELRAARLGAMLDAAKAHADKIRQKGGVVPKTLAARITNLDTQLTNARTQAFGLRQKLSGATKMQATLQKATRRAAARYKRIPEPGTLTGAGGGVFNEVDLARRFIRNLQNDPDRYKAATETARRYRELADASLQYAVDKGLISKETAATWRAATGDSYVDLHRVMEGGGVSPGGARSKISRGKQVEHRLQGSGLQLEDPFVNLTKSVATLVHEADRNEAMRSLADLLSSGRRLHGGKPVDLSAVGWKVDEGTKGAIKIIRDGKPEWWQFEEGIHEALERWGKHLPPNIVTTLARYSRDLITSTPAYVIRNSLIRDTLDRLVTSPASVRQKLTIWKADRGDTNLELAGGSQAGAYMRTPEDYYRTLSLVTQRELGDKGTVILNPKLLFGKYREVLEGIERLNRGAEYKAAFQRAKAQGMSDYDAKLYGAKAARDLLDFARAGYFARMVNAVQPFTTARIGGTTRFGRIAKARPASLAAWFSVAVLAPKMLVYAWNASQGNEKEAQQQPPYLRDMFLNIKTGPDSWLRIPQSHEAALFAGLADRMIAASRGDKHAFEGFWEQGVRTLTPVELETLIPQPFVPIFEVKTNRSFFTDSPIVPPWELNVDADLRKHDTRASKLGQGIADQLKKAHKLGFPVIDNPHQVDHLIRSFFSDWGGNSMRLSDVGRTDKGINQRNNALSPVGLVAPSPSYSARDVRWVLERAEARKKSNHPAVRRMKALLKSGSDSSDPKVRDARFRAARELAATIRKSPLLKRPPTVK